MANENVRKRKLVTLVALEVFTPYKAGEVFSVDEELAEKLLKVDSTKTDFGRKYPKVKVRLFNPDVDMEKLLEHKVLNVRVHNALLKKLHPDAPLLERQSGEFVSGVTEYMDKLGIDLKELEDEDMTAQELQTDTPAPRSRRTAAKA